MLPVYIVCTVNIIYRSKISLFCLFFESIFLSIFRVLYISLFDIVTLRYIHVSSAHERQDYLQCVLKTLQFLMEHSALLD